MQVGPKVPNPSARFVRYGLTGDLAPFQQLLSTEPLRLHELLIVVVASSITFWSVEVG